MPTRQQALARVVGFFTTVGMALSAAYVLSIGLSEVSGYLARLEAVGWMLDFATVFSVPWEAVATVLVILRWRDLPQRFWITYFINGFLAYFSLPIYLMHFGV